MSSDGRRILEGVRVVDMTQIVAGPYCTRMLADLGADVVKIDAPATGAGRDEPRRSAGPLRQNAGKRSIVVDITHPKGLEVVRELVAGADVLVQNYRPGSLAARGLGYDDLRHLNPRLIYASISGFGDDTSLAGRGAFGATAHAEAGWIWIQQQAQGGDVPFAPGVMIADIAAGMNACTAIVAALYDRERTGEGQAINIALMDSQLAVLAEAAAPALAGKTADKWTPFRHGLQRAKDGYLTINLGSPRNWPRLARAMGTPEMPQPPSRQEADALLAAWVAKQMVAEAAAALQAAGAPHGIVLSIHDALAQPYVAERQMVADVPDPAQGTLRVVASPLRFSEATTAPRGESPFAGTHTRAILAELGHDSETIERLFRAGVVGEPPG